MKVFLLLISLLYYVKPHAQNIYSLENRLAYVKYLTKNKDYKTLLTEIESIEKNFPDLSFIQFQKVNCLLSLNQYQKAFTAINQLKIDSQNLKEYTFLLFKCSLLADSVNHPKLAQLANSPQADKELNCYYYFYTQGAALAMKYCNENIKNTELAQEISEKLSCSLTDKYKKPFLAASLSVLPGLGQMYTHQKTDALTAFFSVALNGLVAYSAFEAKGNQAVLGWAAATLTTGFYLGNIVGAWQSAKRVNELNGKKTNDEIKKRIADLAF
jgi:hypothetical protein